MILKKTSNKKFVLGIAYFFFIIGFFRGTAISGFTMFSSLRVLDQLFTLFQYCGMAYIIYLYFAKGRKISLNDVLLWIFLVLILISTAVSEVGMEEAISFTGKIFFVTLWFRTIYKLNDDTELRLFVGGLNALQIVNLVFMILFYGGAQYANYDTIMGTTGHVYLLGYDNGLLMYALPTIVLNYYLFSKTTEKKYKIYMVIVSLPVIISGSVTGILAIAMVLLLFNTNFLSKMLTGVRGILISIAVFVGLASVTIQKWLTPILESLGKGLTLNGRTVIWQWALEYIRQSLFFGYGYNTERARTVFFWQLGITAAHSQLLDLLLQVGIVGLIIYIAIYILAEKHAIQNYRISKEKYWKLLFIVETVFFFVMIVESYSSYAAYPLLFVLFEMGNLKLNNIEQTNKINKVGKG